MLQAVSALSVASKCLSPQLPVFTELRFPFPSAVPCPRSVVIEHLHPSAPTACRPPCPGGSALVSPLPCTCAAMAPPADPVPPQASPWAEHALQHTVGRTGQCSFAILFTTPAPLADLRQKEGFSTSRGSRHTPSAPHQPRCGPGYPAKCRLRCLLSQYPTVVSSGAGDGESGVGGVSSSPHCSVWENTTCVKHCRGKKSKERPDPLYPQSSLADHVSYVPCTHVARTHGHAP